MVMEGFVVLNVSGLVRYLMVVMIFNEMEVMVVVNITWLFVFFVVMVMMIVRKRYRMRRNTVDIDVRGKHRRVVMGDMVI